MKTIKFSKTAISAEIGPHLQQGIRILRSMTGEDFDVAWSLFGRVWACVADNVLLVRVMTPSRPPEFSVVGLSTGEPARVLLPTHREEDFNECCAVFDARSDEEKAMLRAALLGAVST